MKKYVSLCLLLLAFVLCATALPTTVMAASKPTYTVSPSSAPYQKAFTNYTTYNKSTKHYYLLRSYLEQLEKKGGGTLVLKKGTYNISNTLYIPSNVTIQMKDGVVINKTTKTGTKKLTASKTIFKCVPPEKASKKGSVSGYKGSKNIRLIGEGKVVIDLKYVDGAVAVAMGHNQNITVSGITFQNMKDGHFIDLTAAKQVLVENCIFQNHKASASGNKEAIHLDTPDKKTGSFNEIWSALDGTPNQDITIQNNTFLSLERAIGTRKYTENKLHSNVQILNNKIDGCDQDAIRVMNWDSPVIKGNYIANVANGAGTYRAVFASGVRNPVFTDNTFENVARPIQIMPWKNTGTGAKYAIIYNDISEENIALMQKNTLINVGEIIIRYNTIYNEFTEGTYKYYVDDSPAEKPTYTISPKSDTYQKVFTNFSTYNKYTRHYYVIRSYLERLERTGGGTLVLEKGTYNISNTLFIPSDVTIQMKDGVVINKTTETGTKELTASKAIFKCVPPEKALVESNISGYNGSKNIKLIGEGKVVIDLKYVDEAIAVVMGHNQDITVSGITFQNMKAGHFIEMDASWKVLVENCTFQNHKASPNRNKEAINLDTPDKNTEGFHEIWTSYDCTPNKDVTIQNNTFLSLERAIGTHKYTENKLHTNVQILNNTINGCGQDAIRVMNWDSPVIKGNHISNVANGTGTYRAILASGVKNPVFTDNTFEKVARPIQIMPWKNSGPGEKYAIIYNELSQENITLMQKNKLINVSENFIRYNTIYNEFVAGTYKYYIYG